MDLLSSCKDKLAYFRIKELKDVLTQLGLAKQGKKQELVDRILAALSDDPASKMHSWSKRNPIGKEGVEKIIDDIYRKMQDPGATELASKGHISSDISNLKPKEEVEDSLPLEKVRCPCGNSFLSESTIQCEDPRCHVWQHIRCVIIPEKPMDGAPPVPTQFYCEICRINRADPFWVTVAHPLYPVKLTATNVPTDGTNPMQSVEKTFQLTRADRDLLQKTEYDIQAWCILLNDKVPFRMQWPQYADLQVNGVPVRTVNRPGSQLLGANGRDDGPAITTCTREGLNKISLSGCDARIFCLGVRLVKRRSVQQVLNLIPKEPDGEHFEEALARVRRCVGGGTAADNADSDSDLEVVADYITVNLRCPNSGSRIKVAGRFKPCVHMACFDLETFVELNQRSRKWQCPICLKNYSLDNIIIDPYFNRISTMMRYCGEDIAEIDVKPDGFWRVKNEIEHSDLARWHFPDGTLCVATDGDVKPILETTKQVNQEGGSAGHIGLKLGIKKNRNGFWEVSKPEVSKPEVVRTVSSANQLQEKSGNPCQKVIPMSSSATGSSRDGEDPSVNQEGGGNFDFSTNNGNELNSISRDFDPKYGVANGDLSALGHHDVIVLSDSDDENDNLISHDIVYETGQADAGEIPFSVSTSAVANSFHEDPALVTGGSSCLGLFNDDNFELPLWPLRSGTQAGSGFQLFGSDTDVTDALVNVQHSSVTCPMQMNDYSLASGSAMESATLVQRSSICRSSSDMNDGLVDNPLAFGGDDPYLQIFLPTQPAITPLQSDLRDQNDTSNGLRTEDWISLRLGDGSAAGHSESATGNGSTPRNHSAIVNGPTPRNEFASEAVGIESLSNNASLLLGVNDRGSDSMPAMTPANKQRSDSPFSYPRQPRSVRQRTYLSISDSE